MKCTEFERRLRLLVETRQAADSAELQKHAQQCAVCRTLWEQHTVLEVAIPSWVKSVPHVDISERVLSRLADPALAESLQIDSTPVPVRIPRERDSDRAVTVASARHASRRREVNRLAAFAAALVLLAGIMIGLSQRPDNARPIAVIDPPAPRQPAEPAARKEVGNLLRDAGSAYLAFAEGAAHAVRGASSMLPATEEPALSFNEQDWIPEFTTDWLGDWKKGLKPVGDDVAGALNFLRKTVPGTSDEQPKT